MIHRNQRLELTAVKVLIAICVLVFVLAQVAGRQGAIFVDDVLGLSGKGLSSGMLWQFVTYQFVHATFFHLFVNMLGLWFVGRAMEQVWGTRKFVALYLLCGVAGGLLQLLVDPGPTLVGASGAVCGLIAAFSTMYPRMEITALLFFIIPVRMKAMWLGIIVVGLSAFFLVTGLFGNIGNGAHIGGAVAGFAWVRYRRRFRVVR
jgi:membrane associated rhomboid family serine protease